MAMARLQSFRAGKWASEQARLSSSHLSLQLCLSLLVSTRMLSGTSGTGGPANPQAGPAAKATQEVSLDGADTGLSRGSKED